MTFEPVHEHMNISPSCSKYYSFTRFFRPLKMWTKIYTLSEGSFWEHIGSHFFLDLFCLVILFDSFYHWDFSRTHNFLRLAAQVLLLFLCRTFLGVFYQPTMKGRGKILCVSCMARSRSKYMCPFHLHIIRWFVSSDLEWWLGGWSFLGLKTYGLMDQPPGFGSRPRILQEKSGFS